MGYSKVKTAIRDSVRRKLVGVMGLAALLALLVAFQNCSEFTPRKSLESSGVGINGEIVKAISPEYIYEGGGSLTIFGSNFSSATQVKIDDKPCANLEIVSSSEVRCVAPATVGGKKNIWVSGLQLSNALTYIAYTRLSTIAGKEGVTGAVDAYGLQARFGAIAGSAKLGAFLYVSDLGNHTIRSLSLVSSEVKTIAGGGAGYQDGVGQAARFNKPMGLVSRNGVVYVADSENCAIRQIDLKTLAVSTLLKTSVSPCAPVDGIGTNAQLAHPERLAVKGSDLYVGERAPSGAYLIRKIDLASLEVKTIAGNASLTKSNENYWSPDATALTQERVLTMAIESDATAALTTEISESGAVGVRLHFTNFKTDASDKLVLHDPTNASIVYANLSGNIGGDFWSPVIPAARVGLTFDPQNALADHGFKIDKISFVKDEGVARTHTLDGPPLGSHIGAVDAMLVIGDSLYFTDSEYSLLRKLDLQTLSLTGALGAVHASSGAPLAGEYWRTELSSPSGLTTDGTYIYLADAATNHVFKFDPSTRRASVLASHSASLGAPASIDGAIASAGILAPKDIYYDSVYGLCFTGSENVRSIR